MQVPGGTRLTLLACVAAAGAASAQVPIPVDPVPVAATVEGNGSGLGANWQVPPIALSGWVSYDLRATRAVGETNSLSQLVTTHVNAASYVYQPWFATVSGSLGLTAGSSRGGADLTGSEGPFASPDPASSKDRFLTGNGRVDVFPRSRFPFEAHVERSDSRVDSALASTLNFQTQNIGFSQRYRPVSDAYTLSAGFDRREQRSAGFRDTQDLLVGDFSTRWKHNELSVGLTDSQARRQAGDERSEFRSLVGRHQYLPDGAMSVDTTVNWSKTQERLTGFDSDVALLQWNSVGLWQPLGSKLALSGSARGLMLRDDLADHKLDSLGLTLGASYELNRNARITANGSATTSDSDGAHSQGFNGAVGANWQGDTLEYKGLRYDWFASGTAGGSTASGGISSTTGSGQGSETQATLSSQLGHTLTRAWPISPQTSFVLNGSQNLALTQNHSSVTEVGAAPTPTSSRILLHTVAATWNTNADNRSAYARASYNDSRELGGDHARFQLLNLQVSGNFEFDRNHSLSGDLTLQRVAQRIGDSQQAINQGGLLAGERTGVSSASGEIIYRQQRVFGIARLRYTSRLKLAQDVLKQPGTLTAIPDRETRLWENRLEWTIGRLETQLIFRVAQVDGRRRDFLMWRVQRSFGD